VPNSEHIYARLIPIEQVEPVDVFWLDKALKKDYHETSVENVLDGLSSGIYQLWRLGEGDGIAVSTIMIYPQGKDLIVPWIAGKGVLEHFDKLREAVRYFGKVHGCRWLSALAVRKGLFPLYKSWGNELGRLYIEEI